MLLNDEFSTSGAPDRSFLAGDNREVSESGMFSCSELWNRRFKSDAAPATVIGEIRSTTAYSMIEILQRGKGTDREQVYVLIYVTGSHHQPGDQPAGFIHLSRWATMVSYCLVVLPAGAFLVASKN